MKETPPIVLASPFSSLELPVIRPYEIDFLEHDEADALYAAAGEIELRWRTLIEFGTEVGLRPGGVVRPAWPPGGLAARADPGHRRDDRERPAAPAQEQEVPPHRPCVGAHPGGHVGADDRLAA